MARVGTGSWSFIGVQAVVAGFAKPAPSDLSSLASVPGVAKVLLRWMPIPRDLSMRREGSKALTPDMHTTVRAKRMNSPVGMRGQ